MQFHTLTIVGVGLIGGSIGLAAKKRGVAQRIVGVGRDAEKLDDARRHGAIDDATLDLASGVREADLVVFCTPVDRIAQQIDEVAGHCATGAILTDVGSTKWDIVQQVEPKLPAHVQFLGCHPLAGSEKKGVDFAQADLFVERWTVLTPTAKTPAQVLDFVRAFWQALGARTRIMKPDEHDRAVAMTSHLPHLLAAALVGILPAELSDLAATGFRDTTRVASGDSEIWTPIFQQNRMAVLGAINQLVDQLHKFRHALFNNDAMQIDALLTQAKKVRDALGS